MKIKKLHISFLMKNNKLFTNSAWGVFANIFQNIFFSIFFVIMARLYNKIDFANYIIANTLYSFFVGFSTLGLGYWFIRELINTENKINLIEKFFKIQLILGLIFFFLNIIITSILYSNSCIQSLSLIMGINIIFDNIIYVIKYLNIAEQHQKKSSILSTVEALLKCIFGFILFIYPVNIFILSVVLIGLRLFTLNLFIRYGCSDNINLKKILLFKINISEFQKIISTNWAFVVIGSLSIVNWRVGNIIVSKYLNLSDVTNYEISFKLFSIAYILPVVVSSSIYPVLINKLNENINSLKKFYFKMFIWYGLFGLIAYTFFYSFSDIIIPFLFGNKYIGTSKYCKELFLVMLVFPTLLIQANLLLTLKLEKLDMYCNLISLIINIICCIVGLYFFKSLSTINYSLLISFIIFHFIQDFVLIKHKIISLFHVAGFYLISLLMVFIYYIAAIKINKELLFIVFWIFILSLILITVKYKNRISIINNLFIYN